MSSVVGVASYPGHPTQLFSQPRGQKLRGKVWVRGHCWCMYCGGDTCTCAVLTVVKVELIGNGCQAWLNYTEAG